jgi:hypothetical protein
LLALNTSHSLILFSSCLSITFIHKSPSIF